MSSSEGEMGDAHLGLEYKPKVVAYWDCKGWDFEGVVRLTMGFTDGAHLEARESGVVCGVCFQSRVSRCVARLPVGAWASFCRCSYSLAVSAAADVVYVVLLILTFSQSVRRWEGHGVA